MDWTSFLAVITTVVVVITTVVAVHAMIETKRILKRMKEEERCNVTNNGQVNVTNSGNNSGVINGTTEIR